MLGEFSRCVFDKFTLCKPAKKAFSIDKFAQPQVRFRSFDGDAQYRWWGFNRLRDRERSVNACLREKSQNVSRRSIFSVVKYDFDARDLSCSFSAQWPYTQQFPQPLQHRTPFRPFGVYGGSGGGHLLPGLLDYQLIQGQFTLLPIEQLFSTYSIIIEITIKCIFLKLNFIAPKFGL